MRIPASLPFRVEIWTRDRSDLMETIAASSNLLIARAAYTATIAARPKDRMLLCYLAQIVEDREPPG